MVSFVKESAISAFPPCFDFLRTECLLFCRILKCLGTVELTLAIAITFDSVFTSVSSERVSDDVYR